MKWVALLRGINVGGNCKVEMKSLKKLFEELGFTSVSTYINSGNVLFESELTPEKKLKEQIEIALMKAFKFQIKIVLRDARNIQFLAEQIPAVWTNDDVQRTDILFLWEDFDRKESVGLIDKNPEVDTLLYLPGAIVWHVDRKHYTKSGMHKFIGSMLYKNMTARNVNTVRKLASLLQQA